MVTRIVPADIFLPLSIHAKNKRRNPARHHLLYHMRRVDARHATRHDSEATGRYAAYAPTRKRFNIISNRATHAHFLVRVHDARAGRPHARIIVRVDNHTVTRPHANILPRRHDTYARSANARIITGAHIHAESGNAALARHGHCETAVTMEKANRLSCGRINPRETRASRLATHQRASLLLRPHHHLPPLIHLKAHQSSFAFYSVFFLLTCMIPHTPPFLYTCRHKRATRDRI